MAKNQYEDLTERQRKFAEAYFEVSNGTKAAIMAGYGEAGAGTEAHRQLKNAKIQEYLAELHQERRERVQSRLATMAVEAAEMMFDLAKNSDSDNVRATALKDVLDRAGYKAVDKVESKNELAGKIEFGFVDPNE